MIEIEPTQAAPIRMLAIVGSVRPGSRTGVAAQYAMSCLTEQGYEGSLWDLGKLPLPIADPAYHYDPASNPASTVRGLVQVARRADCFLLASPVYHNSYSGVLKNALDCLSIEEFEGKPVGVLAHGPKLTAVQVCDHLRIVARGLYGLCVPEQVVTTKSDYKTDADGRTTLADPRLRARVSEMVAALIKLARR